MKTRRWGLRAPLMILAVATVAGCASSPEYPELPTSAAYRPSTLDPADYTYVIGPGDSLKINVWNNRELTTSVTVRPDGKVTIPLAEDVFASGLTPSELAKALEDRLKAYVREPIVSVIVEGFVGPFSEQIRVVGETTRPQSLPYRENMTMLDVMIAVGGLTEYAAGNRATLVRVEKGEVRQYGIRLDDLVRDGDITANVDVLPGDILIVPETWF